MKKSLVALIVAATLAGCAQLPRGIRASDEELSACASAPTGCSVWTENELQQFIQFIANKVVDQMRGQRL